MDLRDFAFGAGGLDIGGLEVATSGLVGPAGTVLLVEELGILEGGTIPPGPIGPAPGYG